MSASILDILKQTGKTEDDLKEWVLKKVPQDSKVRNIDTENNISKLENWVNDTIPVNSLDKKDTSYKIYAKTYIRDL